MFLIINMVLDRHISLKKEMYLKMMIYKWFVKGNCERICQHFKITNLHKDVVGIIDK